MSAVFDLTGTTMTRSGFTAKLVKIRLGGWEKGEIDVTSLSNTSVKTKVLHSLKEYKDNIITAEFDPAVYKGTLSAGNALTVFTFPNSAGTISVWADVKALGEIEAAKGSTEMPTFDLTLMPTNLNGSNVETAPY